MKQLVNANGSKIQQKTVSAEELLEKHIKHINLVIPARYVATVILRDTEEREHVVYSTDSLANVMKAVVELQDKYPANQTAH